nr:MAG TPA: hypothetical protein [Caudoviricetes sp.]
MMYSTSSDIQNLAMSSRSRRIARSTTGSTIWTTICHFWVSGFPWLASFPLSV